MGARHRDLASDDAGSGAPPVAPAPPPVALRLRPVVQNAGRASFATGETPARMKIHEHQAKELLRGFGVGVPRGVLATTPFEAEAAARQLGGGVCAVKAQILAGGRGKAGGVKLARSPRADARAKAPAAAARAGKVAKGTTRKRAA